MGKITGQTKRNILDCLQKGFSQREVASKLCIPKSTVAWHSKKGNFKPITKKGRHKILSERDENFCVNQISTGKIPSTVKLSSELKSRFGIQVSKNTIRRVLKKKGLKSAEKKKKPLLSKKNIKERLDFARAHQYWTADDWERVIFSDETKVNRFNSDGRAWCWSRDPSALNDMTVSQTVKHGGGHIMLWGCMTSKGVGYSCKIDNTLDQQLYKTILEEDLMDTIEYYHLDHSKIIFQHDNDPKHTAKSIKEWLKYQDFETMVWPAQSPDLNPIEHLWSHLKRRLNSYPTPAKGINELWERVQEVWNEIDEETCFNLIRSMPSRVQAVLKSKGKWTKY